MAVPEGIISESTEAKSYSQSLDRVPLTTRLIHALEDAKLLAVDLVAAMFGPSDDFSKPEGQYWRDNPQLDSMYHPQTDAMRRARARAEKQGMQF